MKNYFWIFLLVGLFLTFLGSVVQAQFFPKAHDIKDLEKITSNAEKTQIANEKKALENEKLKKLNTARFKEFLDIRKKFNSTFSKDSNTKESGNNLAALFAVKEFYWRGRIYYTLMNWSKTFAEIKADMKDENSVSNQNGTSAQLMAFAEMASTWSGDELTEKIEKKIDKKLTSLAKKFVPFEENKRVKAFKETRIEVLSATKKWLKQYPVQLIEYKKFLKEVTDDTFDHRPIWDIVNSLRDEFNLSLKAQEWIEVIKVKFPNDPYIILGYDLAYYADLQAQTGSFDEGMETLTRLRESIDDRAAKFRRIRGEIESKMKEKNLTKEDLNSEEQMIMEANLSELRESLRELIRSTTTEFREFKSLLEDLAKQKKPKNNNWRDNFRKWNKNASKFGRNKRR